MEDLDKIEARYPDDDPIDLDVRALIAELRQAKLQNRELEERLTKQRAAFAESSTDRERELDKLNDDLKNRMLAVCDAVDGFLAEEVVTKLVGPEHVEIWKKAKADFHRDFAVKRDVSSPKEEPRFWNCCGKLVVPGDSAHPYGCQEPWKKK